MRRLLLGCWLLTTACGAPEEFERQQQPIYEGKPAPEDTAVVGVVNFAGGQCSGSLIAPSLVLTARHCVADTAGRALEVVCGQTAFEPPDSAGAIFVVPLPELTDNPDDYLAVSEIRMPDGIDDDLCGTDVALLRLKQPVRNVTPLALRTDSAPAAGEPYAAIGFGADEAVQSRPSGVRKRGDGYEVQCGGSECSDHDVRANEWLGDGGPCHGDSGGPALDAEGLIIGVVSRGGAACSAPIFSDVATRKAWLEAELLAVAEPAAPAPSDDPSPEETCAVAPQPRFGALGSWCAVCAACTWWRRRSAVRRVPPRSTASTRASTLRRR